MLKHILFGSIGDQYCCHLDFIVGLKLTKKKLLRQIKVRLSRGWLHSTCSIEIIAKSFVQLKESMFSA